MEQPLISIVLCTYNGEKYIEEQLNSLKNQTYKNIEIIVSDDCSTDSTIAILKNNLSDKRIKIFEQIENIGYIKNFEWAVSKTSGNFIAFSDQDDIWQANKIEILYNNIGNYLIVYCDSELVDENGLSLNKKLSQISKMYTGSDTRGFVLWNVIWGHTMMIKKELLQYSLPIPEKTPHDIWLAFKACTLGGIKYVDEVLTKYRQHTKTVTKTTYKKQYNQKSRTSEKLYDDYVGKLYWIKLLRDNERSEQKEFYKNLVDLYKRKEEGKFVWSLFFYLFKYRKFLFLFREKKLVSQLIELRKQSRGVNNLSLKK